MKTTSKAYLTTNQFMAGHPKFVAAVTIGVMFVVASTLSTLVAIPHKAFARAPIMPRPPIDVAGVQGGHGGAYPTQACANSHAAAQNPNC